MTNKAKQRRRALADELGVSTRTAANIIRHRNPEMPGARLAAQQARTEETAARVRAAKFQRPSTTTLSVDRIIETTPPIDPGVLSAAHDESVQALDAYPARPPKCLACRDDPEWVRGGSCAACGRPGRG